MPNIDLQHINNLRRDAKRPAINPKDLDPILYGLDLMPKIELDPQYKAGVKSYFGESTNVFEEQTDSNDDSYTVANSDRPVAKLTSTTQNHTLEVFYEEDYHRMLLKELDTIDSKKQPVIYAVIRQHLNLLDTLVDVREMAKQIEELRQELRREGDEK